MKTKEDTQWQEVSALSAPPSCKPLLFRDSTDKKKMCLGLYLDNGVIIDFDNHYVGHLHDGDMEWANIPE